MTDNTQSDVVEQLRAYKPYQISDGEPFGPKFCAQAADEIERLRALTSSDAVLEERERCARIAEKGEMAPNNGPDDTPVKATRRGIAAAIRKGDNA